MKEKLFFLSFFLCLHFYSVHALEVVNLSCEMSESPLTVTEACPRFGWQIVSEENGTYQTAYAIELYEWKNGRETLLWETGKIPSQESQFIIYEGSKKLRPLTKYSWRVRIWNEKDAPSPWSKKSFLSRCSKRGLVKCQMDRSYFKRRSKSPTRKKFSCHRTEKAGNQRLMEQRQPHIEKKYLS
jgi:alpha-L-rhamnosidase